MPGMSSTASTRLPSSSKLNRPTFYDKMMLIKDERGSLKLMFGTLYERMGGAPVLRRIVEAFYPKVQAHPLLGPLFPDNIFPVMEKQEQFLSQFFGGPTLYSDRYGHPMMRARHMPFPITRKHADAWLGCMAEALEEIGMEEELRQVVLERLKGPAYHFINQEE